MRYTLFLLGLLSVQASAVPSVPEGRRLKDIVAEKYPEGRVWIGATIGGQVRAAGGVEEQLLRREFSYTTPENEFKQSQINPQPDTWNWTAADQWLDYCAKQQLTLRIHGPIGPQISKWPREDNRTPEELAALLDKFMKELCERYQAQPQVRWMDVVNETVDPKGDWFGPKPGSGGWENPWTIIGADSDPHQTPLYISRAFAIATRHAPKLKLIYNQHTALEPAGMERVKQTVVYLRQKGLRVDGIGWQAHVRSGWEKIPGNLDYLSALIRWCHQNKLEFHVTEMNVHLAKQPQELEA
ncbi:MAG: Endo,4-beta-xylanase precursor [Verrucomicrobiota bacterium]|jgi:GH35 family endo-1,4-beta-xylanase